jgi:hypothetical protein
VERRGLTSKMAWLALLFLSLALTSANAQSGIPPSAEFPFETTRQPFVPRLLVSRDAPLCNAFLSALRKDFLAQHRGQDSLLKEPPMTSGHWMVWPSGRDLGGGAGFGFAEVDLDQDGKKQLLLHVMKPFNWRGNHYDLLIRSNAATDGLENEIVELEKLPSFKRQTESLKVVASADLPGLWRWGVYNGFESPFKVLLYRDAAYLYTFADGIMVGGVRPGTANLERIHADGSLDLQCQASVIPRPGALPHPWYGLPRQPDTLAVPLEVVDWMQTIRAIQGSEGQMAGTLHALSHLIIRSTYVWYDALVRPWDMAARPYGPPALFMRAWIHEWGYQSLSRFRLARAFEAQRLAAIDALARYYEQAFGIPNAGRAAELITDRILSASFVVHVGDLPSDEELRRRIAETGSESTHLRTALLIGSPADKLLALIKAGEQLPGQTESGVYAPEPALFYALEHPDEVRLLLDGGADIDEGNSFGKTALMYAAHYDLADTVTLLLARGADVSKRTHASTAMDTNMTFVQRTALMYATENASTGVIQTLIQAGADTCAFDSGNRDVANYLSRNRRLSADERTQIAALIAADQPCDR